MLTWTTVGMPVHSSFSSAICVQSMKESQRTVPTKLDQVYTCIYMYIHVYLCINVFNQCVPDDLLQELVFFNTFEELNLPIKGPMEDAGVIKLYEPSPTQCLPGDNMVDFVSGEKHDSNNPSPVQQGKDSGWYILELYCNISLWTVQNVMHALDMYHCISWF